MLPAGDMLRGLDVSHYQGRVDWQRVAAAGFRFVWAKATEGATEIDESLAEHWSGALAAGLLRGAYHFMTSNSAPEEQAAHFLRTYPGGGELPVALDLERGARCEPAPRAAAALAWVHLVEAETGARVWIYCSPSYVAEQLQGDAGRELAARGLWLAAWQLEPPRAPAPWSDWSAWQTGKGRVPGIKGDVDLDVMIDAGA